MGDGPAAAEADAGSDGGEGADQVAGFATCKGFGEGAGEQDREWTPGSTSSEEAKTSEESLEESSEEMEEE